MYVFFYRVFIVYTKYPEPIIVVHSCYIYIIYKKTTYIYLCYQIKAYNKIHPDLICIKIID